MPPTDPQEKAAETVAELALNRAPGPHTPQPSGGERMEIVHVTDVRQLAPEDRKFCEATKA